MDRLLAKRGQDEAFYDFHARAAGPTKKLEVEKNNNTENKEMFEKFKNKTKNAYSQSTMF